MDTGRTGDPLKDRADRPKEATMIPVKSIEITRAEGPIDECGVTVVVSSFAEASRVLARIAETAPNTGGYDKTDFRVTWADGEIYDGRADIQRDHVVGYDLADHIRSFLGYLAGTVRPAHVTSDDKWEAIKASNKDSAPSALEFLSKYDLSWDAPPTPPPAPKAKPPPVEPPSHFEGSKYQATKDLRTVEIAKLIRKDLKAAFPGVKFSVTCGSGHNAIDVEIKSLPHGVTTVRNPHYIPGSNDPAKQCHTTEEAMAFEKQVEAVVNAYNFDRSDIQSDYFNVNFYESVKWSSEVRNLRSALTELEEISPVLSPSACVPLAPFPKADDATKLDPPPLRVRSPQSEFLAYLGAED